MENESEWSEWSDFENDVETIERIDDIQTSTASKASFKDENVKQMVSDSVQEPEDNYVLTTTYSQMPNTNTAGEKGSKQQPSTNQKTDTMATDEIQETSLEDEKREPTVSVGLQKSEDNCVHANSEQANIPIENVIVQPSTTTQETDTTQDIHELASEDTVITDRTNECPDEQFQNISRVTMGSAETDSDLEIPLSVLKRVERCEDSDLDLTLAEIRIKHKQQHDFRELTPSDNNDSDADLDYKPSKKDINSSDSDSNESYVGLNDGSASDRMDEILQNIEINDKRKAARKELNFSRDKQWKRTGKKH